MQFYLHIFLTCVLLLDPAFYMFRILLITILYFYFETDSIYFLYLVKWEVAYLYILYLTPLAWQITTETITTAPNCSIMFRLLSCLVYILALPNESKMISRQQNKQVTFSMTRKCYWDHIQENSKKSCFLLMQINYPYIVWNNVPKFHENHDSSF